MSWINKNSLQPSNLFSVREGLISKLLSTLRAIILPPPLKFYNKSTPPFSPTNSTKSPIFCQLPPKKSFTLWIAFISWTKSQKNANISGTLSSMPMTWSLICPSCMSSPSSPKWKSLKKAEIRSFCGWKIIWCVFSYQSSGNGQAWCAIWQDKIKGQWLVFIRETSKC